MSDEQRFQELKKNKAWVNPETRAEYYELKKQFEGDEKKPVTIKSKDEDERVAALEAQVRELSALLQSTPTKQVTNTGWKPVEKQKEESKTATLRMYRADSDEEYGLIVDWKFHKKIFNDEIRDYEDQYKLTVLVSNGKTKDVVLSLREWMEINEFEIVEIEKWDKVKMQKYQGVKPSKVVVPATQDGYIHSSMPGLVAPKYQGSQEVDLMETMDQIICTIKLSDGRKLEINSNRLNQ